MFSRKYTKKISLMLALGLVLVGLFGAVDYTSCLAAEETTKTEDEDIYKLNDEVKKWLDAGHGIPSNAKYATLASTSHLWVIDSTDISDGKVELSMGDETRILAGLSLRDWLNHQKFYGEGFAKDRVKFVRPNGKNEEF